MSRGFSYIYIYSLYNVILNISVVGHFMSSKLNNICLNEINFKIPC